MSDVVRKSADENAKKSPDESPKKKGGLGQRLITAAVAVPILLWILLAGPAWAWFAVVVAAVGVGLYEFFDMTVGREDSAVMAMGTALGMLFVFVLYFAVTPFFVVAAMAVVLMAMFLTVLFSYSALERAAGLLTASVTGIVYVALLTGFLTLMRRDPGELGRYWIILILAIAWGSDTGAYFAGRFLGRHRLSPVVSPKKTWEGAFGGVVAATVAAFLVVVLTPLELSPLAVVLIAIPGAVLGQIGDLCESLLKRACKVKDSGRIIYGHGGILDRIDAVIFVGTYVYLFYAFAQVGYPEI